MTTERRDVAVLVVFWLAVGTIITWLSWASIGQRQFPDPDDFVRLLEVRDWIAGQSWFDVTQYRLNPPAGVPMHWSRLVDIPLAAVILLFRPFVGQQGAETAALVAVPLLTLGVAMALVQRIALRLMTGRAALVAAAATPFSLGGLKQMRPMRIDHHGWQIVMALIALLAAMDERPRRSGTVAGIALAVWMNISIEGLPFAAAIAALFGWQWLADRTAGERLAAYLQALAVSSLLLFGLTHWPSTWLNQPRDVVTSAHLGAFVVAALTGTLAMRADVADVRTRIAMLALVGGSALAAMFAVDPHWLTGPFGSLDPLVRHFWYERVDEGLPMWKIAPGEAAVGIAQPLVGLAGGLVALRHASGDTRSRWLVYVLLLAGASLAAVFVIRTATTASVIALPGTAYLCQLAFRRARRLSLLPARVLGTAGALCIMTPAYAAPLAVTSEDPRFANAVESSNACSLRTQLEKLRALPTGQIAAPLDITPAILVNTAHRAIASGHHRNPAGMRDVIRLFIRPPAEGAAILAARNVDYVVLCHDAPESIRYANQGPNGLAALLASGRAPGWLEPVALPRLAPLQIWRVRKDLLPTPRQAARI